MLTDKHARGIVGIHERIGCTIDTCVRLRTARLYLAAEPRTSEPNRRNAASPTANRAEEQ
ncbi:hypothetical protein IU421_14590 [Nocardia cyriacigeorgica]|uniref:hypothetical protein n=1 Tax=Nocardia cyriacigeorgica TaxID=135487 RepID=UPI0018932F7E|nr:hypothetical protein [Nocardia cyriacigeorgica]MBF6515498.1 hypothetical protein [Nocardia cyriacigeorgica]